ncbi:hypothetical protein SynMVIR181_01609 [Synechococcus sp. MVIR-18-1]|nr:hypothetical protein SynMVIR181_01609 [Synechococcus sp. MVIR-18-1]
MELRSRSRASQPESRDSEAHRIGWLVQPVVPERLIPVEAERCTPREEKECTIRTIFICSSNIV